MKLLALFVGQIHEWVLFSNPVTLYDRIFFDSSQEVEQPSSEATVSAVGEGGEDEPDDDGGQPSLEEALAQLGLTSLTEKFHQEEIDFDSLVSVMIIL